MRLLTQSLPADFNLFCYGDDHEGTVLRDDSGWQKLIEMMESPYGDLSESRNYGVDHGDCIDAIATNDVRYHDSTSKESSILIQVQQAIRNRWPIRKKLICILQGNHELKLHRFGDLSALICKELNVQYGTWSCVNTYQDKKGDPYFKHFAGHGWGQINSIADDPTRQKSNMLLSLKRKLKNKMGDCLLMSMGHTHKLLKLPPTSDDLYITSDELGLNQNYRAPVSDDDYIHPDHRWYLNTGSFHRTYELGISGYNEIAGYNPLPIGFHVVRVRNRTIEDIDEIKV
jgi:hypothetical protein